MSRWLGDFRTGITLDHKFTSVNTSGAPTTLSGTPAISVYKDNSTTQSTSGVTLTADFDSVTGLNNVRIDTSSDGTFYSAGSNFQIVITTGTVSGTSVVGYVVGSFSLENRSALMPTTAGRKLDVSAGGEAGVDWANVGSPTTVLGLTGTTISSSQVAASVTGNVGGNVAGSVASVTAGVTVTTNNDKTGYALSSSGQNAVADAVLDRNMATGTDSGTDDTSVRTPRQALRALRNKVSISGGTMTVKKEDDATTSHTAAVTTAAGDPISQIDPT